jgi:hypothetical protein
LSFRAESADFFFFFVPTIPTVNFYSPQRPSRVVIPSGAVEDSLVALPEIANTVQYR